MRFLLNIGNTHSQIAKKDAGRIVLLDTVPTDGLRQQERIALLESQDADWSAKAACVVPAVQQQLQKRYPGRILFVSATSYPAIDFSHYEIRTLGADRIANAAAAYALKTGAVLVLDCGTCITTEAVDVDGVFRGGAILPGRAMQRRSLAAFTAQLPEIPMLPDCSSPLGGSTSGAIAAGVDLGSLGAVRELVAKTKQEPGLQQARVVAVGGDAAFFVKNIPGIEAGPESFTLLGISFAKD